MNAFTAGICLVLVQLCVALVMAGARLAMPEESCTHYWAKSGLVTAVGVLAVVLNAGAPNYIPLLFGNTFLMAGIVLQWQGLQAFYRGKPSKVGWYIISGFFLAFLALLAAAATVEQRGVLISIALGSVFSLCLKEVLTNWPAKFSFAASLAVTGLFLLIGGFGFRTVALLADYSAYVPGTASSLGVVIVYLLPLVGTLLFSIALFMLYFEKLVAIKHHLATHDELTGLLNRRAIVISGKREMELAVRMGQPLAVAYLDVDHFKSINDELGHENGDAVLAALANVLKETCRNTDLASRYGGEEFCVVLPGIGFEGACAFAGRVLDAVRGHDFGVQRVVTVSIGLAVQLPAATSLSWGALMHQADSALYQAKREGRDRFVMHASEDAKQPPVLKLV